MEGHGGAMLLVGVQLDCGGLHFDARRSGGEGVSVDVCGFVIHTCVCLCLWW